jgi:hypothetical protein
MIRNEMSAVQLTAAGLWRLTCYAHARPVVIRSTTARVDATMRGHCDRCHPGAAMLLLRFSEYERSSNKRYTGVVRR